MKIVKYYQRNLDISMIHAMNENKDYSNLENLEILVQKLCKYLKS